MTATDAPLQQPSIAWQTGRVQAIVTETSRVKSIILQPAQLVRALARPARRHPSHRR
ncbi:hypothetical protein ACVWZ3_009636 [Bradyrhizobium sp. i1.3.6]